MAGLIRIGISGWTFAPWRGVFYPKGLKREHELEYAAGQFRTIEISDTFYGLQRPGDFDAWASQVPAHFVFAVKAPRLITHMLRLRDVEVPLANFIASGLLRLGVHLGPILWRLPPNLSFNPVRLEAFFRLLPHSTEAAARLARTHDDALRAAPCLESEVDRPLRHAIEVRHDSFRGTRFVDLLRAHDIALVCADASPTAWPWDTTTDFVYCRLHGAGNPVGGSYDTETLDAWSGRINSWAGGDASPAGERTGRTARRRRRDVFVILDNAMKVRAPVDAMELIRRLRT